MRTKVTSKAIDDLFKIKPTYSLKELCEIFSCTYPCLWMHMHKLNYCSSFTHNSRYCALVKHLNFDHDGICFINLPEVGDIGYTRHGGSKALIVSVVGSSDKGMFEREIRDILKIRVSNQLNVLTHEGKIRKEKAEGRYKYFSGDEKLYGLQNKNIGTDIEDNFNVQEGADSSTQDNQVAEYEAKLKKTSESRDKWRERSNTYRKTIKLLSLRIRDLTSSRNHWKQRTKEYKEQNNKLGLELQEIKKNSGP